MRLHPAIVNALAVLMSLSTGELCAQDYSYEVEGYSDEGYVYGEIDAWKGSQDVEGYVYTEEGDEKYFSGEWSGTGQIEGYDEDGNYIELETE